MAQHNIGYKVFYRDIKYPRLEFTTGKLTLILPYGYKPDTFVDKYKDWIFKKTGFIKGCLNDSQGKKLVKRTEGEFKTLIHSLVEKTSKRLDAGLNNIYLRKMKTKWASLSPKRNLTINTLMKHLPEYLVEYIIFHEIAHLIEKRHNENFWEIMSKEFNNYRKIERDLFIYWFKIASPS